jgi:hypothetical protein
VKDDESKRYNASQTVNAPNCDEIDSETIREEAEV